MERVAARLLAGLPITAATLGGSVTVGAGSSGQKGGSKPNSYPQLFFRFLNASFPHRCAAWPSGSQSWWAGGRARRLNRQSGLPSTHA